MLRSLTLNRLIIITRLGHYYTGNSILGLTKFENLKPHEILILISDTIHFHYVFVFSAADVTKEPISTNQKLFMQLGDSELVSHIYFRTPHELKSDIILIYNERSIQARRMF